jgi:two-component system sensor histidine kinase SenX3
VDAPEAVHGGVEPALLHLEVVTDRAAEAVAESSAEAIRLRRALDTLPQGVIVCDENGEVVFRNTRAVGLMGGRHGDALAAQAVVDLLSDAWQEGSAERTLELYGPPRRTLAVRTQLIDDGRRTLGVIAVIDDVSERRRLEEVRRDFVANVSHELKTPMGALGLLAETLISETDQIVAQRLASRIHTEAFRVSRIIDDLLDLSRIEFEEAPPREPVLVNLVMAEALERVRAAAEQRDVKIHLEEPDPQVVVLGDRRQLVSALYNLLENAVKFSYDGGTVRLGGTATAGKVRLEVEDMGIGIPARDLDRIFERFYRVDHGRSRQTGGTGLGLSIVRHVAANHQGSVEVDSREGEGSTFRLILPTQPEVG